MSAFLNPTKVFSQNKIWYILCSIVLLIPILFYGWRLSLRSPRTNLHQQLFPGISYERKIFSKPRPLVSHIIKIELSNSAIQPVVTNLDRYETDDGALAMTTSEFIREYDVDLAVNGSFFYPFSEDTPWNYFPHSGDLVYPLGETTIDGKRYGKAGKRRNVLCFSQSNLADIPLDNTCPRSTFQSISGMQMLLKNGKNVAANSQAYARTAAGINRNGDILWLVLVDGKQPFYSEGATLKELADIFISLGCDRAINLDGGGSTTLAVKQANQVTVLNAPIHTKIPMRERPVANHLGFKISS